MKNKKIKNIFISFLKGCRNEILRFLLRIFEIVIFITFICLFINWSNDSLVVTFSTYTNNSLPDEFDGFRILQISDLNGKDIADELTAKTKELDPDIIVITGDYINASRTTKYNLDTTYIENCKDYDIYYVTGEQEYDSSIYSDFKIKLKKLGVTILDDNVITLGNKDKIDLIGMNDSSFYLENLKSYSKKLKKLSESSNFKILLSHRPELIDIYTDNKIDLVLSGHALGGQINLPFVNGLYSSNQGFYPNYTSGFYTQERTTLYVSRGIGNTYIPIRLFNRPEINIITLKK